MIDLKQYEPFFGEWYLVQFLGQGGLGEVHKIQKGEEVSALKIIHRDVPIEYTGATDVEKKEYLSRFADEILNAIELVTNNDFVNVVRCYEVERHLHNDSVDILFRMDLLEPLDERIRRDGIKESDVRKIGLDICTALESFHKFGILHRDIKLSNILCDGDSYKLGDFDTAVLLKDSGYSRVGTYRTMAPEVLYGRPCTIASDIYSLGMTLYLLLNDRKSIPPEERAPSKELDPPKRRGGAYFGSNTANSII